MGLAGSRLARPGTAAVKAGASNLYDPGTEPGRDRKNRPEEGEAAMMRVATALALALGMGFSGRAAADLIAPATQQATPTAVTGRGGVNMETITLGGGCFWCLEAVYEELKGVASVESGYAGGKVANPDYRSVCEGTTGHAEVVRVHWDPAVVSLRDLLHVFFVVHDPTTKNRQGADVGTQYRSIILYGDDEQKRIAEEVMREIAGEKIWGGPLVTELTPLETFYRAEEHHQDYFAKNPEQGYCQVVVRPKVLKTREKFAHLLRGN